MTTLQPEVRPGESRTGNISIIFGRTFGSVLVQAALIFICLIWTLPTAGLFVSSFRSRDDIYSSGWWTVLQNPNFTLDNYNDVLTGEAIIGDMGQSFLNSLTVTIPATIIPIAIAAFAAYAFAWMEFPGRRILFVIVVGLMVVPLQMALLPLFRLYNTLGLNGTFVGVWLAHTGFGLPLAIFLLRSYIGGLPRELIESASIDGASHFSIFIRLVVPLSVPALASFAIFQFLWVWNDLLVAIVFLGSAPDAAVVTVTLSEMVGSRGADWHILTAGAFITMLLPLAVFFSLQRYFVRGLLAGSVKG